MNRWVRYLALGLLAWSAVTSAGQQMLMARVAMKSDLAMEYLRTAIEEHGYAVAHVQKCDSGLAGFGFHSDTYRVFFFGKLEEVRRISEKHPEFSAYLPLKIALEAEKDETLLAAVDPTTFERYYAKDRDMIIQFRRWKSDIRSIFAEVRKVAGDKVVQAFQP
ncbi:MAG: DUF302 domain-containing protein [Gammaproteobacteria bacterium]|nr:MAG: DUF302 domain-containing protein [Gammaproteobacteria bacterium]